MLCPDFLPFVDVSTRRLGMSEAAANFQDYLQGELVRRCRTNSRYSLRAFARSLAIEPSLLSKLLSGKRRITPRMLERLSSNLPIPQQNLSKYRECIQATYRPTSTGAYKEISADSFALVSEWYHYAILELLQTKESKSDPRWIARRLEISHSEAKDALARLERLGFIVSDAEGNLKITNTSTTTLGSVETSVALRSFQRQVLEKALQSLENTPAHLRDQSGMTMSIAVEDLPKAKDLIRQFRRNFCRRLQSRPDLEEVYQLSISFFPLSSQSPQSFKKGNDQ